MFLVMYSTLAPAYALSMHLDPSISFEETIIEIEAENLRIGKELIANRDYLTKIQTSLDLINTTNKQLVSAVATGKQIDTTELTYLIDQIANEIIGMQENVDTVYQFNCNFASDLIENRQKLCLETYNIVDVVIAQEKIILALDIQHK